MCEDARFSHRGISAGCDNTAKGLCNLDYTFAAGHLTLFADNFVRNVPSYFYIRDTSLTSQEIGRIVHIFLSFTLPFILSLPFYCPGSAQEIADRY